MKIKKEHGESGVVVEERARHLIRLRAILRLRLNAFNSKVAVHFFGSSLKGIHLVCYHIKKYSVKMKDGRLQLICGHFLSNNAF